MKQTQNLLHNYRLQSTIITIQEPNISITVIQSSSISIIFLLSIHCVVCWLEKLFQEILHPKAKKIERNNNKKNPIKYLGQLWIELLCHVLEYVLYTECNEG